MPLLDPFRGIGSWRRFVVGLRIRWMDAGAEFFLVFLAHEREEMRTEFKADSHPVI
jgi:hypothetical protein